jgi:hypothetical protein
MAASQSGAKTDLKIKTAANDEVSLNTILTGLTFNQVLQITSLLKDPAEKRLVQITKPPCSLGPDSARVVLEEYLKTNLEITARVQQRLGLQSANLLFKNLLSPKYLNQINAVINEVKTEKETQEIEKEIMGPVVPSQEKLIYWQQELKLWEEQYKIAQAKAAAELPEFNIIEEQIKKLQQLQLQMEQPLNSQAEKFLSPEERFYAVSKVNQRLSQQIAKKKEALSQQEIEVLLQNISSEDLFVDIAFSEENRAQLAQQLSQTLNSQELQELIKNTPQAQKNLTSIIQVSAPTRDELKKQVQQQFGFSDKKTENFVRRLERNWPELPSPTKADIQKSIMDSFSLAELSIIKKLGLTELAVAEKLSLLTEGFYKLAPLAQPLQGFNLPISKSTHSWVDKLSKWVKVDPVVLENWFRGVNSSTVFEKQNQMEAGPEKDKLGNLFNQTKELEAGYKKLPLFTKFRLNIIKSRSKIKFSTFFRHKLPEITKLKIGKKFISYWIPKPKSRVSKFLIKSGGKLLLKGRNLFSLSGSFGRRTVNKGLGMFFISTGGAFKFIGLSLSAKNYARKFLLRQGLKFLAGSILGLGTGGVGTVASALDFGYRFLKYLKTSEGKEAIKKIASGLLQAAAAAAIGIVKLIASFAAAYPLAFAGAGLGMAAAGPIGALFGGGIGFMADKAVTALGGLGSTAGTIGSATTGLFTTAATSLSIGTTTLAAVGIGSSIAATGAAYYIATATDYSSFSVPPEDLGEVYPVIRSDYLIVNKKPTPQILNTSDLPGTVTYTISITATKKDIRVTAVTDQFTVYPSSQTIASPLEFIEPIDIAAGQTVDLPSYQMVFNQQYNDSVVSNQVVATADVVDGPSNEQASGEASVIIGTPETLCFVFSDWQGHSWTDPEQILITQTIAYLAQWHHFIELVCKADFDGGSLTGGQTVYLLRGGSENYGGEVISGSQIILYDKALLNGFYNALYTLAHESGHIIDHRNSSLKPIYFNVVDIDTEGYLPTYPLKDRLGPNEDFAETIGIYPIWDKITFSQERGGKINYPADYPTHYQFADKCIFHDQCPE